MKIIKYGIFLIVVLVASIYLAFIFEARYEKLIRNLFENLSSNNISFFHPAKYFRFASNQFLLTFGFFNVALSFLLFRQTKKQILISAFAGIVLLITSTLLFCYFESSIKLIECTACSDGKRILHYTEVNYDLVFIISLVSAILPAVATELRNLKGQRT